MTGFSVAQVAIHFGVDPATVRRWIQGGCPCVRRGRRGPGGGALLDLEQVAAWRGIGNASDGLTVETVMTKIATALYESLTVERADICAGIDRESTAAVLLKAFDRCCREFEKTYISDLKPEPIRALMRVL